MADTNEEHSNPAKAQVLEADTAASAAAAAAADCDDAPTDAEKAVTEEDEKKTDEEEKEPSAAEESVNADEEAAAAAKDTTAAATAKAAPAEQQTDTTKENNDVSNSSSSGAKRKPEIELPSKPTKVKKARTAYFMFADEKRAEVVKEHPGEPVGTIAKKIGELWSQLTPEEKQVYQTRALEEKEHVARETVALREAGLLIENSSGDAGHQGGGFVLPVARIRKIVKLDPEVKGLSKEGIQLITKSAELFVALLGKHSVQVATLQNRRKIVADDIVQVCETKPQFVFLQEDIKHLIEDQKQEHKKKEKATEEAKSKAASEANTGVKPLTSFFGPSTSSSSGGEAQDN